MKNTKIPFLLIVSILLILSIILFFCKIHFLTVENFNDGKKLLVERINPNEHFTLKYTHSVSKTPVWEIFQINNKGILILVETHFLDHGAGLPYAAFDNEIFVNEDNLFKIKNMSRIIKMPLYYRIGRIRENYFIFNGKEIDLSKTVGDSVVIININEDNILKYLYKKYLI
ncbi:MAG: DUF1850 domain-containing protein [Atribacterota bacterium]|nr:DUF1850 domain-containing protein [Atribacterota bacterium]